MKMLLSLLFIWPAIFPAHAENSCTTPIGEPGTCVLLQSCRYLYEMQLNYPKNTSAVTFLKKSQCPLSFGDHGTPRVCCRTSPVFSECGKTERLDLRVVNGKSSDPGDWPWMAALGYRNIMKSANLLFGCGGSLIAKLWVITAAHCVTALPWNVKLTTVRLGELNLDPNVDDKAFPRDIPFERVIPHPNFTLKPLINDIALIQLKYPVNFSQDIRPICVLNENKARSDSYYENLSAKPVVTGWGRIETDGEQAKNLQEATLSIVNNTRCAAMYTGHESEVKIDHRTLCAAEVGTDACQGDSGGPLMFRKTAENGDHKYYLGGIVSFGNRCADPNFPGGYTRVAAFTDWIKAETGLQFN